MPFWLICFFVIAIVLCVIVSLPRKTKEELQSFVAQKTDQTLLNQFDPMETRQKEFRHKIFTMARQYIMLIEARMAESLNEKPQSVNNEELPDKVDFKTVLSNIEADIESDLLSPPPENCTEIEFTIYAAYVLWKVTSRLAKYERNDEILFGYMLLNKMVDQEFEFEERLSS